MTSMLAVLVLSLACAAALQRHLAATTSDTPSMGEATKGIMQKARMAKDLYEQQAAIESQVKERCAFRCFHSTTELSSHSHAFLYTLMNMSLQYPLPNLICDMLCVSSCCWQRQPELLHGWLDPRLTAGGTQLQMPASAGRGRTFQPCRLTNLGSSHTCW